MRGCLFFYSCVLIPGLTDINTHNLRLKAAWSKLSEEQQQNISQVIAEPLDYSDYIPFKYLTTAHDKVLYALAVINEWLDPEEIVYLILTVWRVNIDNATVRARLAKMVVDKEIALKSNGTFGITEYGLEVLEALSQRLVRRHYRADQKRVLRKWDYSEYETERDRR